MPTFNPNDPNDPINSGWVHPSSSGANDLHHEGDVDPQSREIGYETSDANVRDTAAFLVIMLVSLAVVFVLAFGIGKLIDFGLAKSDGPANKWRQLAGASPGANFESDPRIQQQQLQQVVKKFPAPRLQTDDGNIDVADMHAREDMLLNHYSWVDEQKQVVRIPISRAMQLLAQRGLPTEPAAKNPQQALFGDSSQGVTAPLTDGFARTGTELQMIEARDQRLRRGENPSTQAELKSAP